MTTTKARIAALETEAQRLAKLAQFEFSPIQAAFYRKRCAEVMAEADALRSADLQAAAESRLLRTGRAADAWYNDRAAARMAGQYL